MSGHSYRLETPRPRRVPSPLVFETSSKTPSILSNSNSNSNHQDNNLLYDLPAGSISPPPISPRSPGRVTSPTSPSYPGRARGTRNGRPTPPPNARNRSQTPQGVAPSDLEQFAEYCRAWYYQQDDDAGRLMTQTLATLPSSQRAPFSRLQASIRSAYHRSVNARKNAEFRAHLTATTPGGSLLAHARTNPRGQEAQKERYERMARFIRTWCNAGMPGTKPFFEALWAIMRLQVIPENLGGAGPNRLEWELDDAVFKESAGKDFMLEAIDILKGVLGFEEIPSKVQAEEPLFRKDTTTTISPPPSPPTSPRTRRIKTPNSKVELSSSSTTLLPKRPRAPSDPFLDAPSNGTTSSHSDGFVLNTAAAAGGPDTEEPPSPGGGGRGRGRGGGVVISRETPVLFALDECAFDDEDEQQQYLRIWLSPDLANPELLQLVKLFPSFVTRHQVPRFQVPDSSSSSRPRGRARRRQQQRDIEQQQDQQGGTTTTTTATTATATKTICFGTGMMWVSSIQRGDGWQGGWWARFAMWWRKIFC